MADITIKSNQTYQIIGPLIDNTQINFLQQSSPVKIGFSIQEKVFMEKSSLNNGTQQFQVRIQYDNSTSKTIEIGQTYMYEETDYQLHIQKITFPHGCPAGVTIEIYGEKEKQ